MGIRQIDDFEWNTTSVATQPTAVYPTQDDGVAGDAKAICTRCAQASKVGITAAISQAFQANTICDTQCLLYLIQIWQKRDNWAFLLFLAFAVLWLLMMAGDRLVDPYVLLYRLLPGMIGLHGVPTEDSQQFGIGVDGERFADGFGECP